MMSSPFFLDLPGTGLLGIRKLVEEADDLLHFLTPDTEDLNVLHSIRNESRRQEWLGVRVLVKEMLNREEKISYLPSGKPVIIDESLFISVAHCKGTIAVLLSEKSEVGIDIEHLSDRIERIVHKFMSPAEMEAICPQQRIRHLYLHWCAKEAIVKLLDRKNLIFENEIFIKPFVPEEKGNFGALVKTDTDEFDIRLHYMDYEDFVVVWAYK
ncbi:MAG: 4'-phosphopantetheinyl transferase superfamily protein [Bacteroidetes bacterium]|nr:4'-phosphopantetheinyl transferase superfamily protein [Bacteroidota bacterium]